MRPTLQSALNLSWHIPAASICSMHTLTLRQDWVTPLLNHSATSSQMLDDNQLSVLNEDQAGRGKHRASQLPLPPGGRIYQPDGRTYQNRDHFKKFSLEFDRNTGLPRLGFASRITTVGQIPTDPLESENFEVLAVLTGAYDI
jgi:hypothetical protein